MSSKLQELMDAGWTIMVSELASEGTPFGSFDPGSDASVLVFHPMDYSYIAYEDPFIAHSVNVEMIFDRIAISSERALARLDAMVDYLNRKNDPQGMIFLPNTTVEENPDGSFTFSSQPYRPSFDDILYGRTEPLEDPITELRPIAQHARRN